ncbi:MAG: radical SAM protein [Desulfovermiculus sp.]
MHQTISFPAPVPSRPSVPIRPVFLPGIGCPTRCIYCQQRVQTGITSQSVHKIYTQLAQDLEQASKAGCRPFELAFFGGTFTALPQQWPLKLLELASRYKREGLVLSVRCSTRPDCISGSDLRELAQRGLNTVELGVQSFCPHVLHSCNRGHGPETIEKACAEVQTAGMGLGLQLLPGLPGHDIGTWLTDVRHTCRIHPDFARIYPCVVLTGTPLHRMYLRGEFTPWTLEQTVYALARGFVRLWAAGIPVIRMGLHPEPDLLPKIAAGPWHPSLGSLVRSKVLRALLKTLCLRLPPGPKALSCPRSLQGDLWGYRGRNRNYLVNMGLTPKDTMYHDRACIRISTFERYP